MLLVLLAISTGLTRAAFIKWCDEPPQIVNPRIIGGHLTPAENFTFQVAVVSLTGDGYGMLCGGTIIDDHWILTAGHCTGYDSKKVYVLMGLSSLSRPKHTLTPKRLFRHPGFNEATVSNDIALIEVKQSLYKLGAAPVCITRQDSALISGKIDGLVSGFGLHIVDTAPTSAGGAVFLAQSDQLLSATVPMIPINECSTEWRRLSLGIVILTSKQLCAGGIMKGTSSGDSGGPLLVRDKYGRLIQVGITSFGASGLVGMLNQKLYPGVYTRVSSFAEWIDFVTVSSSSSLGFFSIFLMILWKGSIWRSVWLELLIFLFVFYGIRFFYVEVIPALDPDGSQNLKNYFESACKEFNEYTKMIPLTFLLGFYVSNVVSRWWCQFEALAWPEDLLSALCMVIPGTDENSRHVRHQIARYLNLAAALAWREISAKIRLRFPSLKHLIDAGLLTEKELLTIRSLTDVSPGVAWLTPLHWSQQMITSEIASGKGDPFYITTLNAELKLYRSSFRRLFCYDWVCVPLVYTQVAALATYAHFAFCLFGRQFVTDMVDFYVPVFTIVQFLFFVGWFKVGQDLHHPFGLDDDDLELAYILDRNIVTSFAIVDCLQTQKPPAWEPDFYWGKEHSRRDGSELVWGRIDLSRTNHKHPPKLHTYAELGRPEGDDAGDSRFVVW